MLQQKELLDKYMLNYYTREEVGYRIPPDVRLEEFWPELVSHRKTRAELLPFHDQGGESFWFVLTSALQKNLHEIDSRGKASLYRVVSNEIQSELAETALIEEALFSSVIEGAFSTIARARELIIEGALPRDNSDQMVKNNALVMRYVLEQKDAPCSIEFLHTLQRIVTDKTLHDEGASGKFRHDFVYITTAQGEVVYTAPPADTVLPSMRALVDWINQEEGRPFIHPILCAAIIHTYFVYVHPYFDGNGRTARSLFYWYLLKHGYDFFRYFSISSIIQETRGQYYKALKDTEDYGADLTYVLLYMTEAAVRAINVVLQRIIERYRRDLLLSNVQKQGILLNERQTRFLKALTVGHDKTVSIARYQRSFGVVFETARRDLAHLEAAGIVSKRKQGRKFVYGLNPRFLAGQD